MDARTYDLIFICRPATPEEEVDKVIATLTHAAQEKSGTVEKTEKWGTRKLAYKVAKHREGIYVYLALHGTHGDMIHELERRLKVADVVIKYMTVRTDDELKRQRKLTERRERRAARRPRRQTAPPVESATAGAAS